MRALHERLGTAGLLVAVAALIAALAGTAIAAGGLLTKQQEKQVVKIAKREAKKYANSNPGPPGANGTNGKDGANGAAGADGADGISVESSAEPKGANCKEGGSKFVAANGITYACNGSPWTAGGTLPVGATETGTFAGTLPGSFTGTDSGGDEFTVEAGGNMRLPISFTVPLSAAPSATVVTAEQLSNNEVPNQCDADDDEIGNGSEPQADPGNLCVFVNERGNITFGPFPFPGSLSKVGAVLGAVANAAGFLQGTWAVTAE